VDHGAEDKVNSDEGHDLLDVHHERRDEDRGEGHQVGEVEGPDERVAKDDVKHNRHQHQLREGLFRQPVGVVVGVTHEHVQIQLVFVALSAADAHQQLEAIEHAHSDGQDHL